MKHKYTSKADFVRKNKKKAQTDVKSNPFEVRINKQKHNVLGKKLRRFDKGMPGVSRSKANKKRKATLLHEYQQRDKRNQFVDRRLGENDPEMTLEDKMLQRFAMERKSHHEKAGAFSLNEEEELTHFGQSLSQIEKFEEPDSDSDDDAGGKLSGEYVKEAHFGGFMTKKTSKDNDEEKSDKPKSKQEMIEEIISKSKQRKYERQHQKEETEDLREKLDNQWQELQLLMMNKSKSKKDKEKPKADDYDVMVRELGFEIKAKASDRLKTEEELAREEQERLQKLEADRQLRMKGLTQEDIREQQQNRHVSADDLDDGFDYIRPERLQLAYKDGKLLLPEGKELMPSTSDEGKEPIRKKHQSEAAAGSEADQSEDAEEEDQSEEEKSDQSEGEDSDQSEEEDDDDSDLESEESAGDKSEEEEEEEDEDGKIEEEEEEEEEMIKEDKREQETEAVSKTSLSKKEREAIAEAAKTELPYTFKAPESLKELLDLLDDHSYDRQLIIIHRIRKCHHPSLADGNKKKLEDLFSILLEYFGKLANQSPVSMAMIDGLTIHLYELAQQSPSPAADSVQTVLNNKYHKFDSVCQRKGRAVYPAMDTLLLFKLVSVIFPTSDFRHSVVTPTMLFMAQILTKCPVTCARDIACGLFVCTLFLQYVSLSKRFVPEVINYLGGLLSLAVKKQSAKDLQVIPPFKRTGAASSLLVLQDQEGLKSVSMKPLCLEYLSKNPTVDPDTDDFRLCATHATIQLVNKFANMYNNLPAFLEIFSPIRDLLAKHLVLDVYPQEVQDARSQFIQLTEDRSSQVTYSPLQYERLKPKPLKLYEPKFDEDYNPERKMKGSRKHKEKERLVKMHKRELKGAVREIRKDAQFLARHQLKEQMDRDAERKRKVKEIMHHLSSQEGECKQIARKKHKIA